MEDPDYAQTESVAECSGAVVVRAIRRPDGLPVLLKLPLHDGPQPLRRLLKERDIGTIPDRATVLFPIDLTTIEGRPALVLEDFAGHPLERELGQPMGVEAALGLAIRVATKLGDLHARGVVHRDLKPENVFVEPRSGEVRLTGLGVALSSSGSYRPSSEPGLIEGTFAYMAPEQTGQTGRTIDQRVDLYSLGVVLYRMLTGRLPLEATDALGWLHVQIAKRPPSVTSLAPAVPPAVGAVVEKLLAKDPRRGGASASHRRRKGAHHDDGDDRGTPRGARPHHRDASLTGALCRAGSWSASRTPSRRDAAVCGGAAVLLREGLRRALHSGDGGACTQRGASGGAA